MYAEMLMYNEHSVNGKILEYTLSSLSLLLLLYPFKIYDNEDSTNNGNR